jgi:vacuolar-type H+-ATPase subunit I/STV1
MDSYSRQLLNQQNLYLREYAVPSCNNFALQVLGQTQDHRHRVLVAAAKNIKNWFVKVRKIKAIYHTLNLFNLDVTQKCLIAECWVPVLDLETIQLALRRGTVSHTCCALSEECCMSRRCAVW